MKKQIIKIQKAIKEIENETILENVLKNCNFIYQITLKILDSLTQEEWFDSKKLLEANRKLVDDKNFVINDIKILINYFTGDNKLEYQAKNIIKNYKKEVLDDNTD